MTALALVLLFVASLGFLVGVVFWVKAVALLRSGPHGVRPTPDDERAEQKLCTCTVQSHNDGWCECEAHPESMTHPFGYGLGRR